MNQIAKTTLQQLGGQGRLTAMIGATSFTYDKNGGLNFRFKGCRKANMVKIEIGADDLYTVNFYQFNSRSLQIRHTAEYTGVFAEDLITVFERYTGLYLSI